MPFASIIGFKMNFPWANVQTYEGGMMIANLNNRINSLQQQINQLENNSQGSTLIKALNFSNTFLAIVTKA